MDLVKVYEKIAASANLLADSEGNLSLKTADGETTPATIGGRRMVLPTREQLDHGDPGSTVVFHPFSENLSRGPSEVLDRLTKAFNIRFEDGVTYLITQLLQLSASEAEHSKLRGEQLEFMTITQKADQKTCDAFKKIVEADSDSNKFVHMYLNRQPKLKDGKKYARAGIVTFPILQELEGETCYGVKLRVKDREMLKAIILYIFPDADVEHSFSVGTMSDQAPYMRALLATVANLAGSFNVVVERFVNLFEGSDQFIIDCNWQAEIDDVAAIAKAALKIPMQSGNEGKATTSRVEVKPTPSTSPVTPAARRDEPDQPNRVNSLDEALARRFENRRDYRDRDRYDDRSRDYDRRGGRDYRDDRRDYRDDRYESNRNNQARSLSEMYPTQDRGRYDRGGRGSGFRDERSGRFFDNNRPSGRGRI